MNWDDLRYFRAVAEARTLQGAARRLGVNHSTIFRRINRFEDSVGARLFERLPDGYQLTGPGEELAAHAARIAEEIDALELKLLGKDYRPSGRIRLTAPDNLAYEYLPRYLLAFARLYPEIEIDLIVGAEALNLTRREADMAIRATSNPPPHLVGRKLLDMAWSFYAAKSYRPRSRPQASGELAGHRLIGADGALARLPAFQRLEEQHGKDIALRCSTLNAMSAMAVAGHGIALMPDDQNKASLLRLFAAEPRAVTEIWLLTHPELRRTERIRLLMEHLSTAFRAEPRLAQAGSRVTRS
jgi:DNA-binding transcriptional LysR family regulator